MRGSDRKGGLDPTATVVGIALIALSGVVWWNASLVAGNPIFGIGPRAMPYAVAGGLAILGLCHLVVAARGGSGAGDEEPADWGAIGWIVVGLVAMISSVGLGVGFIPAMTILFATTARAFGRGGFLVDLAIGFAVSLVVYLLFTKALTLGLPRGPLEALL